MNLRQRFGARILELRHQNGLSQEGLSEKSGVGVQHLSSIENGRKEICLDSIGRLAIALGVSLAELMKDM